MKRSRDNDDTVESTQKHSKTARSLFFPTSITSNNASHLYRPITTLSGHTGPVTCAKYSPDGLLLATCSSDCTIMIWYTKSAKLIATLTGHSQGISSVSWSPDSRCIASASDDKTVRVWEVPKVIDKNSIRNVRKKVLDLMNKRHTGLGLLDPTDLADVRKELGWYRDESGIGLDDVLSYAIGDKENTDPKKKTANVTATKGTEEEEKQQEDDIDEENDDTPLVLGTVKLRRILRGHTHHVTCVSYNSRGNLLVSGSSDENLRIWDVRGGRCLRTLAAHSDPVTSVEFSSDGTLVASGSQDGLIRLWDTRTGQCLKTLVAGFSKNRADNVGEGRRGTEENPNAAKAVMMIKFTPNMKYLLAGTLDADLRMWDYMSDKVVKTYRPLELTESGDANHKDIIKEEDEKHDVNKATSTANGGSESSTSHTPVIDIHKYSSTAIFIQDSPRGTLVARGTGEDGDILFWNLQSREVVDVLDHYTAGGHTDVVLGLDIHPQKTVAEIVSASRDGTCKIWQKAWE